MDRKKIIKELEKEKKEVKTRLHEINESIKALKLIGNNSAPIQKTRNPSSNIRQHLKEKYQNMVMRQAIEAALGGPLNIAKFHIHNLAKELYEPEYLQAKDNLLAAAKTLGASLAANPRLAVSHGNKSGMYDNLVTERQGKLC